MMKNLLKIKEPIWISQSIGIAAKRAFADLKIEIMYKDKYGNKVFPAQYFIRKEDIIKYPIQYCGKTKLYIIPIKNLEIINER